MPTSRNESCASVYPSRIAVSARLPGQSVLDAALAAGLNLPHSCKGGNCGACRARLLQGEISYPTARRSGLSAAEVAEGWVLLCQARARSDLLVETCETVAADQVQIKRLPCRIERSVQVCRMT